MNQITTSKAQKSVWTETKIKALMALWDQGVATSEIGRRLDVTKNSVVGKAQRLGLERRKTPINNPDAYNEARKRTLSKKRAEQKARAAAAAKDRKQTKPVDTEADIPISSERVPNGCRWIDGNPQDVHDKGEDIYCNAPKAPESDWCEHHHARVYIPLSMARRMREKTNDGALQPAKEPNWNPRYRPTGNGPKTTRRKVEL